MFIKTKSDWRFVWWENKLPGGGYYAARTTKHWYRPIEFFFSKLQVLLYRGAKPYTVRMKIACWIRKHILFT